MSQMQDIRELFSVIEQDYGRLDILMNNAGILITRNLEEMKEEDIDRIYQINYKSVVNMTRIFMPMIVGCKGNIVNNASIDGMQSYITGRRSYLYASAKAAVIQFSKICALNYASKGVRVNCLCPGITETGLFTNRETFVEFTLDSKDLDPNICALFRQWYDFLSKNYQTNPSERRPIHHDDKTPAAERSKPQIEPLIPHRKHAPAYSS